MNTEAKVKLAQIGKCVSEGFTTAVKNGHQSLEILTQLEKLIINLKGSCTCTCGVSVEEKLVELERGLLKVIALNIHTVALCELRVEEMERIAQEITTGKH